jgi:DNA repair exonuclease SbcCD ATPase subunit
MIVNFIKARDFMRFREFSISNIPKQGSIAIVGENESGKSAIGEMVSFALFGETPRARDETAFRVVRWGSDATRVELGFTVPGMGDYVVVREMDADGMASAVLRAAENDEVLAEGLGPVADEIQHLLSFAADEFRYSFYLAQNELDIVDRGSAHRARDVIFSMLGIRTLEQAAEETRTEMEEERNRFKEATQELALKRGLLENFEYDPAETGKLKRIREEFALERDSLEDAAVDIEEEHRRYTESLESHVKVFDILSDLSGEVKYTVLRRELFSAVSRGGALFRGLFEEQEGKELSLERHERELSDLREREARARSFHEKMTGLRNMVHLQRQRRLADLSAEGQAEGTNLAGMCDSMEGDLKKSRLGFTLGVVEAVLALGVGTFFAIALHSVASGSEYLSFLKDFPPDLRLGVATVGVSVLGLFGILLVFKAVFQKKAIRRKSQSYEKALSQLKTARVEAEALARIDFEKSVTIRQAQPQIAEKDIRESMRSLSEDFSEFIDASSSSEVERDRAEQARITSERELRTLLADVSQRQALLDYMERRMGGLFDGVEDLDEAWMNATPSREEGTLNEKEKVVYTLFDRLQAVRAVFVNECAGMDPSDRAPQKSWDSVKAELTAFAGLLTETMGFQGGIRGARFETFLASESFDSPDRFLTQLDEEFARLRSAFPSQEELRRKLAKLQEDLERARARTAGLDARLESTDGEIDRLAPRHAKFASLTKRRDALEAEVGPLEHDIAMRQTLLKLYQGTADNIKNRLGPEIGRFIGKTISRITRNRYGNAAVNEDLEIRIFSREKNGLITLDEVSGGTRDQVLLCLRLALSQALVRARMGIDRGQFLFLDEPVSSFDEVRSLSFLNLVREFSPNFQQVFVTLHIVGTAPKSYESIIRTTIEKDVLKMDLS